MSLKLRTFSNRRGPNVLYKALSHPLAADPARKLIRRLAQFGRIGIYDPQDQLADFLALYPLDGLQVSQLFVQRTEDLGRELLGLGARPVTELANSDIDALLLASFDAGRLQAQINHLLPGGVEVLTLDELRLPEAWISDARRYLSPINFVTNFAFFRDDDAHHTTLATANYWSGYGADAPTLQGLLFAEDGSELCRFSQPLGPAGSAVQVDSRELRRRHALGPFTGQLFLHITGAAGHDVLKYALDFDGEAATALSCTHDANAWPAERYGGLPTPRAGERVWLWLQNSHPTTIPAGDLRLRSLDGEIVLTLDQALPPLATRRLELPELPEHEQLELEAGRHLVRPRYEIRSGKHERVAHVNVYRGDLESDREFREVAGELGKGYLLPAPVLDPQRFDTELLVTPMSAAQDRLGLRVLAYDAEGRQLAEKALGLQPRSAHRWLSVSDLLERDHRSAGHLELCHDPEQPGDVDGWFHAIFRYRHRESGHLAETSFGCHLFNGVMTYRREPQSYAGPPPGLSTRLFLRLGPAPLDTFCHLIYPSSTTWHELSSTRLRLIAGDGRTLEEVALKIPLQGSRGFLVSELFQARRLREAGNGAWVQVRDPSCRLFGYHGLSDGKGHFSLDHMFGF